MSARRGRNQRCFNGLPYHCGFPQVRIVCQQIREAFRSQFCGRAIVNAVLIAIENRVRINAPSAELEAGGRVEKHSSGMSRICWHTILTCGNPQWYGKPLKQRGLLSRQGEHSSKYWCQQDSVFVRTPMRRAPDGGETRPSRAIALLCVAERVTREKSS